MKSGRALAAALCVSMGPVLISVLIPAASAAQPPATPDHWDLQPPVPSPPSDGIALQSVVTDGMPLESVVTDGMPLSESFPPDPAYDANAHWATDETDGFHDQSLCCPHCGQWHVLEWLESGCWAVADFLYDGVTGGPRFGHGAPLVGTSWLNRPHSAGWFLGGMLGDQLIAGRVDQNGGFFGGYRIGHDLNDYWGLEARLAWGVVDLSDVNSSTEAGTADVFLGDLDVLYYPWGDTRWRPYFLLGLGMANIDFIDENYDAHHGKLVGLPIALGVKYLALRWIALRAELADNIAFAGSGLEGMHNVSLTAGVEVRFRAQPKSYWPWHASRHYW